MLCPELSLKNFSVLGLRKIVIIKEVVEARRPACAERLYGFGVVHFASNLSKLSCPRKYKRFGLQLQFKGGELAESNRDFF
jgi:hypothetical protein